MTQAMKIAAGEWTYVLRSRLAVWTLGILVALVAVSALNSDAQLRAEATTRAEYQRQADEAYRAQPDRHPHRMVHYGHYVFRTPAPLAVLDPGVDSFTGRSIFLEGHRRNTATFSEARETSVLTRFGSVSPAFSLQVLAPLLLILIGFSSVARERERGILLQLLAQGTSGSALICGKAIALAGVAALALLPLLVSGIWLAITHPAELRPLAMVLAGHAAYLAFWVGAIVAVSALASSTRSALIVLIGAWVLLTVLVPRLATDVAASVLPTPNQAEIDIRLQAELRAVGDSHNINDPGFQSFQQQVLEQYGVSSIEELPVNYRGLVSLQGEAESSAVMDRLMAEQHALQRGQSGVMKWFALVSPYIAIRHLSMSSAGTDLLNHQQFLDAAEAHRFNLIQGLNTIHAEELDYADDSARSRDQDAEQRTRVNSEFWSHLQEFDFTGTAPAQRAVSALTLLIALLLWLTASIIMLRSATARVSTL
ncbi:MAG: DUF3526 domain-containing protein [Gammaproteobacteria bacterium]|nr:DUF3526 domain-containing protein [Gammaproteobacteria bacterium]